MIPVAFYAPLKAPDHPNPSGDRELARALIRALQIAGFEADLASDLRLLDTVGNASAQRKLAARAASLVPDLITKGRAQRWRVWVTYHNYYKAPDLIGPVVSNALGIPYVQIESTRAKKRLDGPWADFALSAEAAADSANVIFYFTHRDAEALRAYAPTGQALVHLAPFLPIETLPTPSTRQGPMLTIAMMRPGDKLQSYRLIAETLTHLEGDWILDIAGDGAARTDVETMMAPFAAKVRFLGQVNTAERDALYADARLMFWPGVNEAIGLTYLEAQAAGIPVLAQDRPGLRDVIAPSLPRPQVSGGAKALALGLTELLDAPPTSAELRGHIAARHLLSNAAATLRAALMPILP